MLDVAESSTVRNIRDLPGPSGVPILGNLLQLDVNKIHNILEDWSEEFGPEYKIRLGKKDIVVTATPEFINYVLRNRPAIFRRLSSIEPVFKEIGINGLFSAEGDDWKRQRRIVMKALDKAHLRNFFPTLKIVTERLKKRWEDAANNGTEIDIQQDLMRYTVDVTTFLAFGYDGNTLENDNDIIQQHLEHLLPAVNRRINAPFPYWQFFKLPADKALDKAMISVRVEIEKIIGHCKQKLHDNPKLAEKPTNFLEAILSDADNDFSDDDIFGNILTILLAGEDTTANSLAWSIYHLTEYPEIQKKLQLESHQILNNATAPAEFSDLEKFEYSEAVICETLRLKSVTPILFLEPMEDIEFDGIAIPKGTPIFLLTRKVATDESTINNASKFSPERWLVDRTDVTDNALQVANIPFGAGPRFCPGRHLSLVESKMVLSMLSQTFNVTRTSSQKPKESFSFTMMPENLMVTLSNKPSL
ncbi:hypothetical protein A9Q99_07135 [Gammaproteobacteria bacterium 45_16_T64]|nr:hypothetical protein A9Q99_07135 [Gammaproteobacteria bacterium 45_16_T64]